MPRACPATGLEQIERGLDTELIFADSIADASSRYLLEAGGKRVRPMLILLTAQLGAGNTVDVIGADFCDTELGGANLAPALYLTQFQVNAVQGGCRDHAS